MRTRTHVGTNKLYAEYYHRRMDQKIAETIMAKGQPDTLTDGELSLDTEPLTKAPIARPVSAWVRYNTVPVRVDAFAVAWTDFAFALRLEAPDGEHRTWVWASAVRGPDRTNMCARLVEPVEFLRGSIAFIGLLICAGHSLCK